MRQKKSLYSRGNPDGGIPPKLYTACLIHELNRPLSVIQVTGESLLANTMESPSLSNNEFRKGLEKILLQLENIRHILGLSRLFASETVNLELCPVNVNEVVLSTKELVQEQLQAREVCLDCDLAPDLPPIIAHPYFLEAALLNLITNASEALPGKDAGEQSKKSKIIIQTRLRISGKQKQVTINISDNGDGIPTPVMSRLFTPFVSGKTNDRGNGLGLLIVKTIVEKCHGEISIDTQPGWGTMILLTFPCQSS